MDSFFDAVQHKTESYLTKRKAKNEYKRKNRTFISEVLDWVDAVFFAVVVVLIINLVLFQLFIIPSPSMQDTLLIGDRVLVGKFTYGFELYPEGPKVFDSRVPDIDEIITFYNPQYESRGPLFSTLSTVIYMATFSLVNIDRKEDGSIREKLLVKRCAAKAGDTIAFKNGDAWIRPRGVLSWKDESSWRKSNALSVAPHRTIEKETYVSKNAQAILEAFTYSGVPKYSYPLHLKSDYSSDNTNSFFTDYYCYEQAFWYGCTMVNPMDKQARSKRAQYKNGIYVPEGFVLPLGDNRDNSSDGRYFGPVPAEKINGHVVSRIWPAKRIGSLYGK